METPPLLSENTQALIDLAVQTNEQLEGASQASAYRAFNLGCTIGILPAALVGLIAFFLADNSWIAAVVTFIILLIGVAGFAALAAVTTRAKRMDRIWQEQIEAEIHARLTEINVEPQEFNQIVDENLPVNAAIRKYLKLESPSPA